METAFFELVDEIKAELKSIDDHRLQVAIKMAKAHELFDEKDPAAEGMTWTKFAKKHFALSSSEVKKLVKIGLSDDPKAAMAAHREKARMSAAKSRKSRATNGADVGAPEKAGVNGGEDSPEPGTVEQELDQMIRAYEALSNEARGLFLKWLAGKDGKDALPRDLPVTREAMSHSPAQAARETA